MYGQTFSDTSSKSTAPKSFTAFFLCCIVCYQILSQIFLNTAFNTADSHESDGACSAIPGAAASSTLCMEAHLFHGWNELLSESPEELEPLLAISASRNSHQQATAPSSVAPPSAPAGLRASATDAVPSEPVAQLKPEALEGFLWDLAFKMGGGDQSHSAPEKAPKKLRGAAKAQERSKGFMAATQKKHPGKSLTELQQQLEAKMQSQARRHAEHRALRALSVASRDTEDVTAADDGMTAWAHDLDHLTHDLEDHMKARRKAKAEHESERAAAHPAAHSSTASPAASEKGTHELLNEVQSLGQQLCQDPARRNRPACAQFLHLHSTASKELTFKEGHQIAMDKHADAMAHIKLLEKHLQESTEVLRDLCADPARSSYPICTRLLAAPLASGSASVSLSAEASATPKKGLRGESVQSQNLHWSAMKKEETTAGSHHVGSPPMLLRRQELLGTYWEGKVPKVACITVLPQGQVTEKIMKYFMDNWQLQSYKGARQLVIIHHNSDREAARIAQLYADGNSVIAAAARGGGDFPSATAYRYGAWLAHDADLVARWDFDAWHHPNRLTMQVRAVAQAGRPASLVARITAFDVEGRNATIPGGTGPHGSMLGDKAWMHKHWMPLLEDEHSVPLGLQGHSVVQVDMPELLAYHDVPAGLLPA